MLISDNSQVRENYFLSNIENLIWIIRIITHLVFALDNNPIGSLEISNFQ